MSSSDISVELDPVLNLVPLVSAADTIRSYCKEQPDCRLCQLSGATGMGCYFQRIVPQDWDVGGLIYNKTEDIGKHHKTRPRKAGKK